jgi:hypothetical protein
MVTDRTQPAPKRPHRNLSGDVTFVLIAACIVSLLMILIGGHFYGRYLAKKDLGGRDAAIAQLVAQSQEQKRKIDQQSAALTSLQAKLDKAQAQLDAIMPAKNTFNIIPNQTLIVGDGRLNVGLVGAPGNESITLNINGRQQIATAGQVINVTPDASTNCQVAVQSFDMFKAVVNASCARAKAQ